MSARIHDVDADAELSSFADTFANGDVAAEQLIWQLLKMLDRIVKKNPQMRPQRIARADNKYTWVTQGLVLYMRANEPFTVPSHIFGLMTAVVLLRRGAYPTDAGSLADAYFGRWPEQATSAYSMFPTSVCLQPIYQDEVDMLVLRDVGQHRVDGLWQPPFLSTENGVFARNYIEEYLSIGASMFDKSVGKFAVRINRVMCLPTPIAEIIARYTLMASAHVGVVEDPATPKAMHVWHADTCGPCAWDMCISVKPARAHSALAIARICAERGVDLTWLHQWDEHVANVSMGLITLADRCEMHINKSEVDVILGIIRDGPKRRRTEKN